MESRAFGIDDPLANATQASQGQFVGNYVRGTNVALYTARSKDGGTPIPSAPQNRVDIRAENVATMTIYPARAGVDCNAALNVSTDGPIAIQLLGCGPTRTYLP